MSDLPEGLSESYFFQHADGRQVELLNFRRQPHIYHEGILEKKKRKRKPGSFKGKKEVLRARDGDLCHYCNKEMIALVVGKEGPMTMTVEHIVPHSHGGPNSLDNLVLACRKCNNGFGSQILKCRCAFCKNAMDLYGRL